MTEYEKPGIKSADDLMRTLKKTGSSLVGTTFRETTIRIGPDDVQVVEVEKADGETFFHPLGTEESQI